MLENSLLEKSNCYVIGNFQYFHFGSKSCLLTHFTISITGTASSIYPSDFSSHFSNTFIFVFFNLKLLFYSKLWNNLFLDCHSCRCQRLEPSWYVVCLRTYRPFGLASLLYSRNANNSNSLEHKRV